MKFANVVVMAFFLALGSCVKPYDWVPDQAQQYGYLLYEPSGGPFCSPQSGHFHVYIFENGDLFYYGQPAEVAKDGRVLCGQPNLTGWHQTNLGPETFTELFELLDQHRFFEYAPDYSYGFDACGPNSTTDVGELILELKTQEYQKTVFFDNGCVNSKDWGTIRHLWRSLRQFMALEDWVGEEAYTWDYDVEFENVILREPSKVEETGDLIEGET